MKVALYLRVSTEGQVEKYGLDVQKERLHAYCDALGFSEREEFIDGGYSGATLNRPALTQLLHAIEKKEISHVIVYRLDRLSRSQQDTLYLIEDIFLPTGVEFISLNETIDTTTPMGRAMIGIMSVFAQLERETIAERLYSCHEMRVKELGHWSGGGLETPYGYTQKEYGILEVHNEQARHVVRLFETYPACLSITKLQNQLQAEGFPKLRHPRITSILQNRLYTGQVSFGGTWYPGIHTPLIDKETFLHVQQLMAQNKGTSFGTQKNKLFSGIVKCGKCGEIFITTQVKRKNGTKTMLICPRRRHPSRYDAPCDNSPIERNDLEAEIIHQIKRLATRDETETKTRKYNQQLTQINNKLSRLLELYMDERISKTSLDAKLKELNNQKQHLKNLIETQNQKNKTKQNLIKNLNHLNDPQTKQNLINSLIHHITIINHNINITWNH